ncbi:MAG: MFS transporter [Candidatus Tectomicrobia bacterium]|nr:MFS transporter [Candidatus Tectomicrobia bacterium]
MTTQNRWFLLAMAWAVALNLRGSSIAVSPILPLIQTDLGLSYANAGFLFSVPTVMMALFGLPGGWLADTFGMKRTITLGLTALLAGCALRATATGFLPLVIWTALLGAGMGISSPGLTRMVKDRFPDLPGTATGIYTTGFIAGATLGSWLTVPYLLQWSGSWRGTFWVWSGPALLALLGWVLWTPSIRVTSGGGPSRPAGIWRDKTVWKLNVTFLTHNLFFYCVTSWTPTYYHKLGLTLEASTRLLTAFILMSLPSSLAVPFFSDRLGGRRGSLILSGLILLATLLGIIFFPLSAPRTYFVVLGLASGGVFALCFALPLDYVAPAKVGSVAGANLLVGYVGAFLGPLLMGLVYDLTGSFTAGWLVVAGVLVAFLGTTATLPGRTA